MALKLQCAEALWVYLVFAIVQSCEHVDSDTCKCWVKLIWCEGLNRNFGLKVTTAAVLYFCQFNYIYTKHIFVHLRLFTVYFYRSSPLHIPIFNVSKSESFCVFTVDGSMFFALLPLFGVKQWVKHRDRERKRVGVERGGGVLSASWADLNRHRTKGLWKWKYEEGKGCIIWLTLTHLSPIFCERCMHQFFLLVLVLQPLQKLYKITVKVFVNHL